MQIVLDVLGSPTPQGSKRVFNGRIVEASGEKLKKWRKAIAAECVAAREDNEVFFTGPVVVVVTFFMPRPPSVKRTGKNAREFPIVPPDLDKLCRGLLDGIGQSEMVWGDDSQVISMVANKVYADEREPGALVVISDK